MDEQKSLFNLTTLVSKIMSNYTDTFLCLFWLFIALVSEVNVSKVIGRQTSEDHGQCQSMFIAICSISR